MLKHISSWIKVLFIALLLGVLIPYASYKWIVIDSCKPAEDLLFYFPVVTSFSVGCPAKAIAEIVMLTLGLPATLGGFALWSLTNFSSTLWISDLSCISPLLLSLWLYVVIIQMRRRLLAQQQSKKVK